MLGSKELSAPIKGLILALIVFCFGPFLPVQAATFTVSFDRNPITLGESAILSLTFQGAAPTALPAIPTIPNLQFSDPPGFSSRTLIENGVVSASQEYTYTVTPSQPGDYVIPALNAQVGGQTVTSQPVKLTVLKAAPTTTSGPNNGDAVAFVRLVVPRQKVYVGEVIQARFELGLREDVANIQNVQLTPIPAEGFTVGKTLEAARVTARFGNANYRIIPLSMVFTAAKVGNLTLGPPSCSLDLLFGPFDIFGRPTQSRHVTLTGDPVAMTSVALPGENQPPGFNGAVGFYNLSVSAAPTNIAMGDPVTVTIQIAGRGALDSVSLPDQKDWQQQFKLYPPTSDYQSDDKLDLSGTKTFKLTAVPLNMDVKELPPFSFSYFDPELNSYRTLTQPAIPLIVRPSAASLPPTLAEASTTSDNPPANHDIGRIKPWLGTVSQFHAPLAVRPWFVALQSVPVLAWLCLLVQRRQADRLTANPRLRRERQVQETLRQGLKDLRHYASANQADDFFATLFHLLQERLGERLDLPSSAITEAIVEERLGPLGVPDHTLDGLRELFQTCNQARYAPQTSTEELVSLVPKVEAVLNELKDVKP